MKNNNSSSTLFDYIKTSLIEDDYFVFLFDNVFGEDFSLEEKPLEERLQTLNNLQQSQEAELLTFASLYLAKKSASASKDTDRIAKIFNTFNHIDKNSSTYETLKHYSANEYLENYRLDKEKNTPIVNFSLSAYEHLSKITWEDILKLTPNQIVSLEKELYEWAKITNHEDKTPDIAKLINQHKKIINKKALV